jgi:hypothetical protein
MIHFFTLVMILVFANWGKPSAEDTSSLWFYIWSYKWYITGAFGLVLVYSMIYILKLKPWQVLTGATLTALSAFMFGNPMISIIIAISSVSVISLLDKKEENDNKEWILSSWDFTKQIVPLLAIGVVIAGFLLGSTHDNISIAGVIPNAWISWVVGGNSIFSNLFASVVGAFMYFATLTEVPIIQGLLASGMGKGPALACCLPTFLIITKYVSDTWNYRNSKNDSIYIISNYTFNFGRIIIRKHCIKIKLYMKILILCTGNSCRSQMAQGFLQSFDKKLEVHSAGTKPEKQVNPNAVKVMAELGIDISHHIPKNVAMYTGESWDEVNPVCDNAKKVVRFL